MKILKWLSYASLVILLTLLLEQGKLLVENSEHYSHIAVGLLCLGSCLVLFLVHINKHPVVMFKIHLIWTGLFVIFQVYRQSSMFYAGSIKFLAISTLIALAMVLPPLILAFVKTRLHR